jgi:hypothetical protein
MTDTTPVCVTKYIYIYRVPQCTVCPRVGIGTLPTPLSPASVPFPQNQRGEGAHSPELVVLVDFVFPWGIEYPVVFLP